MQVESESKEGISGSLPDGTRGSQAPARPSGYTEESSSVYASMSTAKPERHTSLSTSNNESGPSSEKSSKKELELGIEEKGVSADGSLRRTTTTSTNITNNNNKTNTSYSTSSEKSSKKEPEVSIEEKGVSADGSLRSPTTISNSTNNNKGSKKELELGNIEEKGVGTDGSLDSSTQEDEGPCRAVNNALDTLDRELSMCTRVADPNGQIPLSVADQKSSSCLQLLQELARMLLAVVVIALQRVFMNYLEVSVRIGELYPNHHHFRLTPFITKHNRGSLFRQPIPP
jgi:hypothetical protein